MSTFSKRIDSGIRDLYDWYDGSWHVDSTLERIGNLGGVTSGISLRFTNVTISPGATIQSAKITFGTDQTRSNQHLVMKIYGVAEDNTGEFSTGPIDDARTRSHTSANTTWDQTLSETAGGTFDTPDIASIIQEIVNRPGWSSGNSIGISIQDNGTGSGNYLHPRCYEYNSGQAALLTITYTGSSPSSSISPSSSVSASPSASESASISPSPSPTPPPDTDHGVLKIAKSGENVLTNTDPTKLRFSSEFGTLKYFQKTSLHLDLTCDPTVGNNAVGGSVNHNLDYFPYCEVFVSVNGGPYEYCPFYGSGASVFYAAHLKVTKNTIDVIGEVLGLGNSSSWTFDFLVFVFKNKLNL